MPRKLPDDDLERRLEVRLAADAPPGSFVEVLADLLRRMRDRARQQGAPPPDAGAPTEGTP
jgi:hypothetical protein